MIFLDHNSLHLLTQVLVICHLDFYKALYMVSIFLKTIQRLQLVQSTAMKVVFIVSRLAHMTSLIHKLHRLPVCFQMQFKMLVMTFKAINGISPGYVINCLILLEETCPNRASREGLLWILLVKEL